MSRDHDRRAERWRRRRPTSGLPIEEILKRTDDGIKTRIQKGEAFDPSKPFSRTKRDGPGLDKKQRKRVSRAADLAIYALANNDRTDYVGAVKVINATRRQAGMPSSFMQSMCDGIADVAAFAAGEDRQTLDQLARAWLDADLKPKGTLISLPGVPSDGTSTETPLRPETDAGAGDEPELPAGESRH